MGRINRRIYSKRRKRSPNKLRFASPSSMSSQSINLMGQSQASGQQRGPRNEAEQQQQAQQQQSDVNKAMFSGIGGMIKRYKYMMDNAKPPYLGGNGGGEGIGGGKTYTITEA